MFYLKDPMQLLMKYNAAFSKAFKEDAAGAIGEFILGLDRVKKEGGNTYLVLEELGMTNQRIVDTLSRAKNASDKFTKSLETGSVAYRENTALTLEKL